MRREDDRRAVPVESLVLDAKAQIAVSLAVVARGLAAGNPAGLAAGGAPRHRHMRCTPRPHMKKWQFIAAAALLAAGPVLGCTRESSRGPVQWTASNPSSPTGQTLAQAWSRSTSSDSPVPA